MRSNGKTSLPKKPKPDANPVPSAPLVPMENSEAIAMRQQINAYKEFVASSLWNPYLDLIRSMPKWSNDIDRDFGLDIFDAMDNDPVVSAGLDTLVFSILEKGAEILPAIQPSLIMDEDQKAESDIAMEVAKFVEAATAEMEIPLSDVLQSMIRDAFKYGWKLAEITLKNATYNDQPCYFARCLDPKPREVYRLVVDRHNRLMCILALIPGIGLALPEGIVPEPQSWPNTVTPEKFVCLTFPGRNRNPQGWSRLRCVYNVWWLKTSTWPQLLQWLVQLAGGFIWAETPEKVTLDPSQPLLTAEQVTANNVAAIRNGSIVAIGNKGSVHVERPEGDGDQFWKSLDGFDRQILTGLLTQAKSHKEAERDSKANVSASTDLTDTVVNRFREVVASAIQNSFFSLLVRLQFGDEYARKYTPKLNLHGTPQADRAKDLTAAAAAGFTVEDSVTNKAEIAEWVGLTPDIKAYQQAQDKRDEQSEAANAPTGQPGQPVPKKEKAPETDKKNLLLYQLAYARAQWMRMRNRR